MGSMCQVARKVKYWIFRYAMPRCWSTNGGPYPSDESVLRRVRSAAAERRIPHYQHPMRKIAHGNGPAASGRISASVNA